MMKVKICGLANKEDALFAASAGADALGIVNVKESRRYVGLKDAKKIFDEVPPFVSRVLVASPRRISEIREIERCGADCIQLHGLEDIMFVKEIRESTRLKLIMQIPVVSRESIEDASAYSGLVDAILLDTKTKDLFGGTGQTHDWNISKKIADTIKKPVILAGGLSADNVTEAIEKVHPYAVDVATGVEKAPGIKDKEKVKEFIRKVKCYGTP